MKPSLARRIHDRLDRWDRRFRHRFRRLACVDVLWVIALDAAVAIQSDRRYLRRTILPAMAEEKSGRLLFVGVRRYTSNCERIVAGAGIEFWTIDIDPAAAPYGAAGRHVTADIRHADAAFAPGSFKWLILNGIFGWGVDDREGMERVLAVAATLLAPGGYLLIGWNFDRSPGPETLGIERWFHPAPPSGLPQRKAFDDVTHVYAWYRRAGPAPQ